MLNPRLYFGSTVITVRNGAQVQIRWADLQENGSEADLLLASFDAEENAWDNIVKDTEEAR